MTFLTDLDDLIRNRHGDTKKLREIRDVIKHDNFITTTDKNYVESLIDEHLKNQPLEKSSPRRKPSAKIKLESRSKTSDSGSQINVLGNSLYKRYQQLLGKKIAGMPVQVKAVRT